jgi:hypothetical protein
MYRRPEKAARDNAMTRGRTPGKSHQLGAGGEGGDRPVAGPIPLELIASDDANGLKLRTGGIDGWVATLADFTAYLVASRAVDPAEVERWRRALEAMRRDGSYARLLRKYRLPECPTR